MTKIIFITSGAIDYQLPGHSLFESVCLTARGEIFPSLKPGAGVEIAKVAENLRGKNIDLIVTAPSAQASQTADLFGKILRKLVKEDENLLPLRFDPLKMMTAKEFERLGNEAFNVLRARFLEDFFEDKLMDKNREIEIRFENLKKKYQGRKVLAVSHAFLIKLFSVYNEIGDVMFTDKRKFHDLFNPFVVPFGRLSGLEMII